MNKRDYFFVVAILILIFAIALWAYFNGKKDEPGRESAVSVDGEEKLKAAAVIEGFKFVPADLKIKKGALVTWTNKDSARHTVTGENGGPSSPLFGKGESYSYVFNEIGTFNYYCVPHPYMKGSVEVIE